MVKHKTWVRPQKCWGKENKGLYVVKQQDEEGSINQRHFFNTRREADAFYRKELGIVIDVEKTIWKAIESELGLTKEDVCTKSQKTYHMFAKKVFIFAANKYLNMDDGIIADKINLERSTVNYHRGKMEHEEDLYEDFKEVLFRIMSIIDAHLKV